MVKAPGETYGVRGVLLDTPHAPACSTSESSNQGGGGEDGSPIRRAEERKVGFLLSGPGYRCVALAWPTVSFALAFEPLGQLQMFKTGTTRGRVSISWGSAASQTAYFRGMIEMSSGLSRLSWVCLTFKPPHSSEDTTCFLNPLTD